MQEKQSSFFKQFSFLFGAMMVVNVSNYLFQVVMSRMLSASDFGILTALLSIFFIISVPAYSIQTVITKYVADFKARGEFGKINYLFLGSIRRLFSYGIGGFFFLLLLSPLVVSFLKLPSIFPVVILTTAVLLSIILPVGRGTLQGLQKFNFLGLNLISDAFLRFFLGVLLVYIGLGVSGAITASSLASFLALVLLLLPLRFLFKMYEADPEVDSRAIYRYFWPTLITAFSFSALVGMDIIFVKHFFEPLQAGYYAGGIILGKIVLFLPGAASAVMLPRAAELYALEKDPRSVLKRSLFWTGFLSGIVTLGYFLFPEMAITYIVGKKYLPITPFIGILGLAMAFFALVNIFTLYQLSIHRFVFIYPLILLTLLQALLLGFLGDSFYKVVFILLANSLLLLLLNWWLAFKEVAPAVREVI